MAACLLPRPPTHGLAEPRSTLLPGALASSVAHHPGAGRAKREPPAPRDPCHPLVPVSAAPLPWALSAQRESGPGAGLAACFSHPRSPLGPASPGCGLPRNSRPCRRPPLPPVSAADAASFSSSDAEGEEYQGAPKVFPRIGVRDPYKRLGLSRDASTEELTEAKNYLWEEYKDHERSREAIEEAFDKIIFEKFRERKKSKINLKADLKKKVAEAPPWVQAILGTFEAPKRDVILQRSALFLLLAAWSVMNPSEGGPAFQVAVALGLSVYLINDRLKSIGRAFLLGFGALIVGWIVGSFVVPFIPDLSLLGGYWSLELGTALISYVFLWFATTFLK